MEDLAHHRELYPEHAKIRSVRAESRAVAAFLEWLGENQLRICDSNYEEDPRGIEQLLAAHFDIDLRKVSAEKDAMLDAHRKANGL